AFPDPVGDVDAGDPGADDEHVNVRVRHGGPSRYERVSRIVPGIGPARLDPARQSLALTAW
ncbi:hypothetical protein, partial [Actinoplanes philippinensis]|uniref:hypothetical protein n=1 Tax=Actinoplanes philippinensis TaxID=35752 RepID=UPI0033E1A4D9